MIGIIIEILKYIGDNNEKNNVISFAVNDRAVL